MKFKQILLLSVVLGILVLGLILKSWVRSASEPAGSIPTSGVRVVECDPAKVERVVIAHGTQPFPVELAKENGAWKVKSLWDAKADPVKVEALIEKLCTARGEFRGAGEKLFPDFGIRDQDAFSIQFLGAGNAPLADLRLGTERASEEGYFIRRASGKEIYLIDLNMAELLGIHMDFDTASPLSSVWTDLRLFDLDPQQVTRITLSHLKGDTKTMVLGLQRVADPKDPLKTTWKFLRKDMNFPADPEKVLKFIATLISIKAQKVVDPSGKDYGLEKPLWQLAVTGSDKKVILNAGPKAGKEDLYYVKTSEGPSVFSLSAGYFDDLNADDTHFVKEAATAVAPEKKT